jgi:hypothetical protein
MTPFLSEVGPAASPPTGWRCDARWEEVGLLICGPIERLRFLIITTVELSRLVVITSN